MLEINKIIQSFDPEKDYTSQEVSALIGITTAALNAQARRGSIPARKIMNRYYFNGRIIRDYMLGEKPVGKGQ